ncbi:flagellar hook-basal body complex protein [Sulfurimonas sp.]|uniref:flagellar hook-basal body complex protein n=1 Tax=Sulfurimonas sp. TaxID=2022749 RepID=UPI00263543E1|nr:flagellar hook-basal body complex protein [Sulfurimonas sp.]
MIQAFYTGISGIKTHSAGIDIVSDNLANINTIGYRGVGYEFSSMFENMINTNSAGISASSVNSSVGVGTTLKATPMMQDYGAPILSDRSTDLAILGDGWFGIQGQDRPMYTRDGNFTFDANDDLVTQDGFHVLGTMGNNIQGTTLTAQLAEVPLGGVGSQEKLRFPKTLTYPPEPSSTATFSGNLGVEDVVSTMSAGLVDPQSNKNELRLEFTKKAVQTPPGTQWDVVATTQTLDGETIYDTQTGTVSFDSSGALTSSTLTTINNNGAQVSIDLGTAFSGVVSISNLPISGSSVADGTIGGDLRGYDINKNGEVIATFTNGKQSSVGKVAVFHFINDQGLERLNGSRFQESSNSGFAYFSTNATGENVIGSDITNFKLEGSNVSMEYGLTELIILQRAYDANSKSITTADQMMQKALQMGA